MTDNHPITPPPELVQQWLTEVRHQDYCSATEHAIVQAAKWGADQELEACCEWLCAVEIWKTGADRLRSNRRPKPPSPKEEALQVLESLIESRRIVNPEYQALRHALEQIND